MATGSLIRRARRALARASGPGTTTGGEQEELRRDLGELARRMDRLRRAFPASNGLLERVSLSEAALQFLAPRPEIAGVLRPAEVG